MTTMTMIQAIRAAMDVMLERDPNVVVFGEASSAPRSAWARTGCGP